jgi:hypothetical protein
LVEFKPVFELICLNSFENLQNVSFSSPSFPCFQPSYPLQPSTVSPWPSLPFSSSAQLAYPAAQSTFSPAGPRRLLSLCLADGWGPVVIPDLRPDPEPEPTTHAAPWLRAASPVPTRCPGTWARTSGPPCPFIARRRTEASNPSYIVRLPPHNPRPPPQLSIPLGRCLSFIVVQIRRFLRT